MLKIAKTRVNSYDEGMLASSTDILLINNSTEEKQDIFYFSYLFAGWNEQNARSFDMLTVMFRISDQ